MNRFTGISLILYVLALGIAVVVGSPRYVFAGTALVITGWIFVGFFSLPKVHVPVLFVAPPPGSMEATKAVAIDGFNCPPQLFPLRYLCTLKLSRQAMLLEWLVLSMGAFYILLADSTVCEVWIRRFPIASTYLGALAGFRAIFMATSWYGEQRFLVKAAITLGTRNQSAASRLDVSKYSFRDAGGGYFGGSGQGPISDPVFVLYDPLKPDDNIALEQLKFRKLVVIKTR